MDARVPHQGRLSRGSLAKWDEGDALFVTFPGGKTYNTQTVGVSNLHTGAWTRYVGWDALCFMQMRGSMFFGTQTARSSRSTAPASTTRTGTPRSTRMSATHYVCRMVGGWEMFQVPPNQVTWLQARATFFSATREPFEPQLAATIDYEFRIPPPPNAGPDPGLLDVWDQGLWGVTTPLAPDWAVNTPYTVGTRARDKLYGYWDCAVAHTSAASGTFKQDRDANPTYWTLVDPQPLPPPPTEAERDAYAQWDQVSAGVAPVKNTMWVSIGETGFSHAPICQVSVGQQVKPNVELVSISATFVRMAANV